VIYRLLTEQPDRPIVYVHNSLRVILFASRSADGGLDVRQADFSMLVDLKTRIVNEFPTGPVPVCICDSMVPQVVSCPTLIVSSPGALQKGGTDVSHHFQLKDVMPLPDEAQIVLMHAVTKPLLADGTPMPLADVLERMNVWGPIPRHVLYAAPTIGRDGLWEKVLGSKSAEIVAAARLVLSGGALDSADTRHRFLLLRAAGQDQPSTLTYADGAYYAPGGVAIASNQLHNALFKLLARDNDFESLRWLAAVARVTPFAVARGHAFDPAAATALHRGGTFTVRALVEDGVGAEVEWPLDATSVAVFARNSELRRLLPSKQFLYPIAGNVPGFDALLWVETLGQYAVVDFTVSDDHGIHEQGLRQMLVGIGWTKDGWPTSAPFLDTTDAAARRRIPYVWVVPEDKWDSWTRPQSPKLGTNDADVRAQLVQYALRMPAFPMGPDGGATKGPRRAQRPPPSKLPRKRRPAN
jgi:hypothetical protein